MKRMAWMLPPLCAAFAGPACAQSSPVLPNGADRAPAVTIMLPSPDGTRAAPPSATNPLPIAGPSGAVATMLVTLGTTAQQIAAAAPLSRSLLEITNTGTIEVDCTIGGVPVAGTGNYDPLVGYGSQLRYAAPGFVPTSAVSCAATAAGATAFVKLVQQ